EQADTRHRPGAGPASDPVRSHVFPSAGMFRPEAQPKPESMSRSAVAGRWRKGAAALLGPAVGPLRVYEQGGTLAWAATLRAAAPYQAARRNGSSGGPIVLRGADLRAWSRRSPAGVLLFLVVDTSGSMGAWQR